MEKEKSYTVQNLITKQTFKLKKSICDDLVVNEPFNFKVLDKDYKKPQVETEDKPTYQQIVDEDVEEDSTVVNMDDAPVTMLDFENMKVEELREYAKNNDINLSGIIRKDDIIKKITESLANTPIEDEISEVEV